MRFLCDSARDDTHEYPVRSDSASKDENKRAGHCFLQVRSEAEARTDHA
jgi:hypothetical protein